MDSPWEITAEPQTLTILSGESGRVVFFVTNLGPSPRLADVEIDFDPGTAHPSWFTVDAPSIVMAGRSMAVSVQVDPRAGLQHGEQYKFAFRGRIGSAASGNVGVTVSGPTRWQVIVSPESVEVTSAGGYLVMFTVTNLLADTATAVLEAPYWAPNEFLMVTDGQIGYELDETRKTIPGFASAAFTLRIDAQQMPSFKFDDILRARIITEDGQESVLSPPISIHYHPEVLIAVKRPPIIDLKVVEQGVWNLPVPPKKE